MGVNLDLLVNLTENMFSLPIENFSEFFYNGDEVEKTVNLTECTTFANYQTVFQSCNIYAGRKIVYACSITKIYDIPVITDIFKNGERVYEADMEKLDNEMSANMDIVKAYRINTLCEEIEKAFTAAENAINDTDNNGILLAYTNYMYNIGRYHAYMDSLDMIDFEKWGEMYDCYAERVRHMEDKSDDIYCSLKKTVYGNVYA
jgi:hypothetical protein